MSAIGPSSSTVPARQSGAKRRRYTCSYPGSRASSNGTTPNLKLIVLLRDPVERAVSHYYMERNRGKEHRPLWLALLSEPIRLRCCKDVHAYDSAMRVCSYRRRGLYSLQLRNLYRFFDNGRVLIIRTRDLRAHHHVVLRRVFAFLGVSEHVRIGREIVFKGDRRSRRHSAVFLVAQTVLSGGVCSVARASAHSCVMGDCGSRDRLGVAWKRLRFGSTSEAVILIPTVRTSMIESCSSYYRRWTER